MCGSFGIVEKFKSCTAESPVQNSVFFTFSLGQLRLTPLAFNSNYPRVLYLFSKLSKCTRTTQSGAKKKRNITSARQRQSRLCNGREINKITLHDPIERERERVRLFAIEIASHPETGTERNAQVSLAAYKWRIRRKKRKWSSRFKFLIICVEIALKY